MELTPCRYQASKKIAQAIFSGHPWVYRSRLSSAIDAIPPGSFVKIVDGGNKFIAYGINETRGIVGLSILSRDEKFGFDSLLDRLREVSNRKKGLFGGERSAYRLLNGEADGFPGLACDVYSDSVIWQPYLSFWDAIIPHFTGEVDPILGTSGHLLKYPAHRNEENPCRTLAGEVKEPIVFSEGGIEFHSFPYTGQKTGFFLDLREVRKFLPDILTAGNSVLNCFSSSGAFSIIAKANGASTVISVDSDSKCREQLEGQLKQNNMPPTENEFIKDNVFEYLVEAKLLPERYGLVILDPPNMCTKASSLKPALKGWQKLASSALPLVKPGGHLLLINCSSFMTREMCEKSLKSMEANITIEKSGGLPKDHTVSRTFPEGDYLKWWLYKTR
ncbi:MAG: class I SAM-dependent methyltransferase [Nitrospinota bacterium]|nr:class I SAM-dependent methyltransferase [Nitrospinota bacterium]